MIGSSSADRSADALLCAARREPGNLECTVTNHRKKPPSSRYFPAIEFCLWDAQDDATNFQRNFSTGQVEVVDGVIYHKTEYRERRDISPISPARKSSPVSTRSAMCSSAHIAVGTIRGRGARLVQLGRARLGAHGSHHVKLGSRSRVRPKEIIFVLGYHENPGTKNSIRRIRRPSIKQPSNR